MLNTHGFKNIPVGDRVQHPYRGIHTADEFNLIGYHDRFNMYHVACAVPYEDDYMSVVHLIVFRKYTEAEDSGEIVEKRLVITDRDTVLNVFKHIRVPNKGNNDTVTVDCMATAVTDNGYTYEIYPTNMSIMWSASAIERCYADVIFSSYRNHADTDELEHLMVGDTDRMKMILFVYYICKVYSSAVATHYDTYMKHSEVSTADSDFNDQFNGWMACNHGDEELLHQYMDHWCICKFDHVNFSNNYYVDILNMIHQLDPITQSTNKGIYTVDIGDLANIPDAGPNQRLNELQRKHPLKNTMFMIK